MDGTDYTASSGTITFNPGLSSRAFDIAILNPPDTTTLRSFVIALTSPTGAVLGPLPNANVTILPPADPPRVVLTASTPIAHRSGPIPGVYTFSRDVGIGTPLTVHYLVSGSATPGVDYAALSGTITIPANQYETTLLIRPIGGSGDRLVTLTLVADDAYMLGRSSANVQISGIFSLNVHMPLVVR